MREAGKVLYHSKQLLQLLGISMISEMGKARDTILEVNKVLQNDKVNMNDLGIRYAECLLQAQKIKNLYEDMKAVNVLVAQSGLELLMEKDEENKLLAKKSDGSLN